MSFTACTASLNVALLLSICASAGPDRVKTNDKARLMKSRRHALGIPAVTSPTRHHHKLKVQDAKLEIRVGSFFVNHDPRPVCAWLLEFYGHVFRQKNSLGFKYGLWVAGEHVSELLVKPDQGESFAKNIRKPFAHVVTIRECDVF
ncbi:MAG: hypothetical protein VX773_02385 [Pseudomonadota bacterium]|nr:hypothetical protein [Pseudomonadota bacterium]